MWRMYLNEELSRVILAKGHVDDNSSTVSSVTSSYTNHPDGRKYGRQMKRLFLRSTATKEFSFDNLPDNMYLVYGIPRVSLTIRAPERVKQLHMSASDLHRTGKKESCNDEEGEEIAKMFKFITHDVSDGESMSSDRNGKHGAPTSKKDERRLHKEPNKTNINNKSDIQSPSKSQIFWENMSSTGNLSIQVNKLPVVQVKGGNSVADISQSNLPKTAGPKRSSKVLWQTIRERKTDILQMRDHRNNKCTQKKEQTKTSQLWGIIFARKKDLIHMKRKAEIKQNRHNLKVLQTESKVVPIGNFEDPFQRELHQRLQERARQYQT